MHDGAHLSLSRVGWVNRLCAHIGGAHMSHYSFLDRMLPRGMLFDIVNGKQYVHANSGKHYLPKCMYVPRHIIDQRVCINHFIGLKGNIQGQMNLLIGIIN